MNLDLPRQIPFSLCDLEVLDLAVSCQWQQEIAMILQSGSGEKSTTGVRTFS